MKKNLLVLAITISTLASTSIALAFDFQKLDKKILSGEITHEQAKQIVDNAVTKGEITQDQIRQHMEKMRENYPKDIMGKGGFGPPPFGPVGRPDNDEFIKKLKEAGITRDEFEIARKNGHEAVKQLLDSHNIQPPPRPCGQPPEFNKQESKN
ncbi:MAG: hypothetical protein PHC34_03125 [Candidatus Gastranaerophilales bacterium]|nr:hypothetical protein [Candidatus Gastranaerophilales bacterium]